ncbi:MAG TPA: DUF6544 family protein [Ignavibacteriales bacterium]|nr:DUF6544 family protein [Ignavibacteriales bacterium]
MLRFIFSFIIFIHGSIHLLGFLKEWKIAEVKELTGKTIFPLPAGLAKGAGALWLLTCIMFAVSAFSYLMKQGWWWIPASIALVISQILIIIYWHDAKFGTIANVIILIMCLLGYGDWSFNRMVAGELPSFLSNGPIKSEIIKESDIRALPPVVQKWMRHSGVIGKDMIKTVHLRQTGQMRTSPEGSWWPFTAGQYFTVDRPGFLWEAEVKANPFMYMRGRDKYYNGQGQMIIKVMSLIPVVDVKGKEVDQGTMLRFLAEGVWFPTFALSKYIKWEEVDSRSARAVMNYGGIEASGIYRFNAEGDLTGFEAMRYYYRKEGSTLEKWVIAVDRDGYKEFSGMRIPAKSSVTWKLKEGDYHWLDVEVTEMEFNGKSIKN